MRFAGVLAPRSKWRHLVVPRPPKATTAVSHRARGVDAGKPEPVVTRDRLVATSLTPSSVMPTRDTAPPPAVFGPTLAAQSDAVEVVAPNVLSLAHWARLRDGELYAAQHRVDWASLLRRTFAFDVKTCPRCDGRLEVRAVVTAPGSTAKILESLARPRAPPRAA